MKLSHKFIKYLVSIWFILLPVLGSWVYIVAIQAEKPLQNGFSPAILLILIGGFASLMWGWTEVNKRYDSGPITWLLYICLLVLWFVTCPLLWFTRNRRSKIRNASSVPKTTAAKNWGWRFLILHNVILGVIIISSFGGILWDHLLATVPEPIAVGIMTGSGILLVIDGLLWFSWIRIIKHESENEFILFYKAFVLSLPIIGLLVFKHYYSYDN